MLTIAGTTCTHGGHECESGSPEQSRQKDSEIGQRSPAGQARKQKNPCPQRTIADSFACIDMPVHENVVASSLVRRLGDPSQQVNHQLFHPPPTPNHFPADTGPLQPVLQSAGTSPFTAQLQTQQQPPSMYRVPRRDSAWEGAVAAHPDVRCNSTIQTKHLPGPQVAESRVDELPATADHVRSTATSDMCYVLGCPEAGLEQVGGSEGSKIVALVWKHKSHRDLHRVLASEQERQQYQLRSIEAQIEGSSHALTDVEARLTELARIRDEIMASAERLMAERVSVSMAIQDRQAQLLDTETTLFTIRRELDAWM